MEGNTMISVAIPYHGDRYKWLAHTLSNLSNVPQISEIVINCEPGSDILKQKLIPAHMKKVKVFSNEKRLYALKNKMETVLQCEDEWVMLIDSDNIFNPRYVDAFLRQDHHNKNIIYCPQFSEPRFDFRHFLGRDITISECVKEIGQVHNGIGLAVLTNNGNNIMHRTTFIAAMKEAMEMDYDSHGADATWINFNCLKNGMAMRIVAGMGYKHSVHDGSTYLEHEQSGIAEHKRIFDMMIEMVNKIDKIEPAPEASKNWSAVPKNFVGTKSEAMNDFLSD